jgi:hypothetical protein
MDEELNVTTETSSAEKTHDVIEELNVTTETTSLAATVPEAVATRAVAAKIASNKNANPRINVQEHPRKVNYRLPLNKYRPSTAYYYPAFTTYSRHNRPENVTSTLDVLDTLLKAFSTRARVDSRGLTPSR